MSRRDLFHDAVRRALEKEGWTITHDPLKLVYGETKTFVDLGASAPLGASREGRVIAVEIKSFVGLSGLNDLYGAVGQFVVSRSLLELQDPERVIFIALPDEAFQELLTVREGRHLIVSAKLKLIVFEEETEVITQWIE